jgi:hypothetical protein
VLNDLKKIQIIKMLALKRKMKCHFMKQGDNTSKGAKHKNDSLTLFITSKFQIFLSLELVLKKVLWRNCKDSLKRSCRS